VSCIVPPGRPEAAGVTAIAWRVSIGARKMYEVFDSFLRAGLPHAISKARVVIVSFRMISP
jgi:hypothetical protein